MNNSCFFLTLPRIYQILRRFFFLNYEDYSWYRRLMIFGVIIFLRERKTTSKYRILFFGTHMLWRTIHNHSTDRQIQNKNRPTTDDDTTDDDGWKRKVKSSPHAWCTKSIELLKFARGALRGSYQLSEEEVLAEHAFSKNQSLPSSLINHGDAISILYVEI